MRMGRIGFWQPKAPVPLSVYLPTSSSPCQHCAHAHKRRAVKDKGAWLRQGAAEARKQERIRAAQFGLQDKGLCIVGSSSHPSQQTAEFMELFDTPNCVQASAGKLCNTLSSLPKPVAKCTYAVFRRWARRSSC